MLPIVFIISIITLPSQWVMIWHFVPRLLYIKAVTFSRLILTKVTVCVTQN